MYTDKGLLNMLNHFDEAIRRDFFNYMDCIDCPLNGECCHTDGDRCEQDIREYYYQKGMLSAEAGEPTAESTIIENEPAAAPTQPHDIKTLIANYRKAKKEYEYARDDIWLSLLNYMVKEAKSFTASQLSDISGLPTCTIAKLFGKHSQYLGYGKYVTMGVAYNRIPYVRLLPNGQVDTNKRNDKVQKVRTYLVTEK